MAMLEGEPQLTLELLNRATQAWGWWGSVGRTRETITRAVQAAGDTPADSGWLF